MLGRARSIKARDAYLAVVRAHEALLVAAAALFREHGLTQAQYNVLRILRGGGEDGLPSQEVGRRLITRVPDVTRMLDRMEAAGWIVRRRSDSDRRVVLARLTDDGRALVDRLDQPVLDLHERQFDGFEDDELEALEGLLGRLLD